MKTFIAIFGFLTLTCTTCFAERANIRAMVVGDKVLEVVDTVQLTTLADGRALSGWVSPNGKWVAYVTKSADHKLSAYIIGTNGGLPVKLTVPLAKADSEGQEANWMLWPCTSTSSYGSPWSPNSELLAINATRELKQDEKSASTFSYECWTLVFDTRGRLIQSFQLKNGQRPGSGPCVWSYNSAKFAEICANEPLSLQNPCSQAIAVFDVASGSVKEMCGLGHGDCWLLGWSKVSDALLYRSSNYPNGYELRECPLDGSPHRVILTDATGHLSPDGKQCLVEANGRTEMRDTQTGKKLDFTHGAKLGFTKWTADARLMVFHQNGEISDFTGSRSETRIDYWLVAPENHKLNHLYLSPADDESSCVPTISSDSTRVAYTYRGSLYALKLAWRAPAADEKALADLSLSEDETKELMLKQARQIVVALEQYMMDHPNKYPTKAEDMLEYVKPDAFLRPGGKDNIFTLTTPPDSNELPDFKKPIGHLDAGYSWRIDVHFGDSEVVQKE
jgi:hypothetical protein